jgi:transposase
MKSITEIIGGAQSLLNISFDIQDCFEEYLGDEYKAFLQILRVAEQAQPPHERSYAGIGRKPYQYYPFTRSFLAMRFFRIGTVKDFIQRLKGDPNLRLLCGFRKVASEATFSRRLTELSETNIMNETLDKLVTTAYKDKIVYHISRDSTAIEAREKEVKKEAEKKEKKRRGRPKKGETRPEAPQSKIEKQTGESAEKSLEDIDKECSYGCKKNSQGNISFWRGYKLHLDISDIGFPVSAVVSGANVHDSQLAIPMEKMSERKVTFLYSLMDAGYDAEAIENYIKSRGRIPIIDRNKRRNDVRPPFDPPKKERYKIRSSVERANGYLKDYLLPKNIFVKGYRKVSFVLMSAVVCLAAIRTLQYFGPF